jgi:tetratricopeptide (TPR) repeat protein
MKWLPLGVLLAFACGHGASDPTASPGHHHDMAATTLVHHAVSCGSAEQSAFDEGLTDLHNMSYVRARQTFTAAATAHPDCAMLDWGIAMTWFQPVWPGRPTPDALRAGSEAVVRARAAAVASPAEREYVAAVARFFDSADSPYEQRLHAWATAQQQLAAHVPDDLDAQAFAALSGLATLDKQDKHKAYSDALAIAERLEALLQQHPHHPGLMHYLLHAYDNPALAGRGVDIARAYAETSPDAAHALHMPSHIFVRLGDWHGVIDANVRSAAAALRNPPEPGRVSRDFLHATDYLVYAYLQVGDDDDARAALAQLSPTTEYDRGNGPAAYGLSASPARFALERRAWGEAAALAMRAVPYDWEHYPWAEAETYAARGLGAARNGDAQAAQAAVVELERLQPLIESPWWKTRIGIDHDVVVAWIKHAAGDDAAAEQLLRAAAARELETGKDNVEPGHVVFAVEQLGSFLLERKQPAAALAAFESSLAESPHRFAALYGAGLAAEQAGDMAKAKTYYGDLVNVAGASKRPELAVARAFVSAHP